VALNKNFDSELKAAIEKLKQERVYKRLNYLSSPQGARVQMEGRGDVVILSSNNYLGLSNDPVVVAAGIDGLKKFGAGTGSVRFICGTFTIHRDLERAIADLVGTEASLSYVSAWNANEGLTATIVEQNDFVVSDALNHASIIDSIRLAKAITKCTTAVYQHSEAHHLDGRRVLHGREHGQASGDSPAGGGLRRDRSC
jgi:glycine C-acetyltransferase